MAAILSLVLQRTAQQTKLAKIYKQLQDHRTTPLTSFKLYELRRESDKIGLKVDELQMAILTNVVKEEDIKAQLEAVEPIDELLVDIHSLICEVLDALEPKTTPTPTQGQSSHSKVKLPKLELPTFGGNYEDWPAYRDQFEATIVANGSLTGCEKLQYLKSTLKDEALLIINPFAITNDNFKDAWDLCTARYNNSREICFSLLSKLFNYPKSSQENVAHLRKLVDTFDQCIRQLRNLERDVDHWDDVLVYTIVEKLDQDTKREWAKQLTGTDIPKHSEVIAFLENHIRGLQSVKVKPKDTVKSFDRKNAHAAQSSSSSCLICSESHPIFKCGKFNAMTPKDRFDLIKSNGKCFNCLGGCRFGKDKQCQSKGRCRVCGKAHHSLLHLTREITVGNVSNTSVTNPQLPSQSSVSCNYNSGYGVLLGTAEVKVKDSTGSFLTCRVLLDSGAEVSFCTERCSKRLGLAQSKCNVTVNGVGSTKVGTARGKAKISIQSLINDFSLSTTVLVLPQVTGHLPSFTSGDAWKEWTHIRNLTLADPRYIEPREIDILLGAEVTPRIFTGSRILARVDQPVACASEFGWLIMGPVNSPAVKSYTVQCNTASLDEPIQRLWELDQVPNRSHMTQDESEAEQHFVNNHTRTPEGRYTVPLPFKSNIKGLGSSRSIALRRLHHTERRLARYPEHKAEYHKFMSDYRKLGHMEEVPASECGEQIVDGSIKTFYLPHHFVLKEDSSTTKLRVVFDGSCSSDSGLSLNDCLMVGPTIQLDVFTHLVKFRMDPFVLKGDITKMYRQFLVPKSDSDFQRILWRDSPDQPVKEYRLKTITYGTSSAPFCAIRALIQLGRDEGDRSKQAKRSIEREFYVDDVLSGGSTVPSLVNLRQELTEVLARGQLSITKWASNSPEVLEGLQLDQVDLSPLSLAEGSGTKALGVQWHPNSDIINFSGFSFEQNCVPTMRHVLKQISRLFDPLGLLAPFVISLRIFFQKLWSLKLGWDDPIPEGLQEQWTTYADSLPYLTSLSIPRCVIQPKYDRIELHGFSDASEQAYCANVYIRAISDHTISCHLLASKTRVAPMKAQSLPRLELCGALLLSNFVSSLLSHLDLNADVYYWTDSTITLRWISSSSRRWLPFVANRVSQIQELTPVESWRFIPGTLNPADLGTRGIPLQDLINNKLWWHGPEFLSQPGLPLFESSKDYTLVDLREERKVKALTVQNSFPVLSRYSSYLKLIRVIGCLLVVALKARRKPVPQLRSVEFYDMAKLKVHQLSQREDLQEDIEQLEKHGRLKQTSSLLSLAPFMDAEGSLRVGGRLHKSQLPESAKHPMIIHGKSSVTKLLVHHFHHKHHHAGNSLLLSLLRQEYWIIHGRDLIKSVCNRCLRCKLLRQRASAQLMGTLPMSRVTLTRPFHHTGVDYAGPFTLQTIAGRGFKQFKAWFCVFQCLATKAVHLEYGTSMSTESFVGTFTRFVSRRGYPLHLYSDCGTNFRGADSEMMALVGSHQFNSQVSSSISESGSHWHFNPASAPHHGGIWEAAVRSVKFHLRRIIGNSTLTLEEFATVLCQTEAALNSRPLCPLSHNVDDLGVITPGHFLIGQPLLAAPKPDYSGVKLNRLSRWELQESLFQTFWKTWSTEYLTSLQQRVKWTKTHNNVKIGDLVAIKDDNLPPLKWNLGRIIKVHPGSDGLVRVITLKTASGELKRPVVKIVPLLSKDELNN